MTDEEKKKRTISLGPAELRPMPEKGHYGLFRPIIVKGWDESIGEVRSQVQEEPVGPLAVFREARKGEDVHMRTVHPDGAREIMLTCVWDNNSGQFIKER